VAINNDHVFGSTKTNQLAKPTAPKR